MDENKVLVQALVQALRALPDIVAVDVLKREDVRYLLHGLGLPDDDATIQRILESDEWTYGDGGEGQGFNLTEVQQELAHVASVLGLAQPSWRSVIAGAERA